MQGMKLNGVDVGVVGFREKLQSYFLELDHLVNVSWLVEGRNGVSQVLQNASEIISKRTSQLNVLGSRQKRRNRVDESIFGLFNRRFAKNSKGFCVT